MIKPLLPGIPKLVYIIIFVFIGQNAFSQSVLLLKANTDVYDSPNDNKILKVKFKEETWVNYKGRYGQYFKISNYFGKDKLYPIGIIEGFVNINSVLDTISRDEYENYDKPNEDFIFTNNQNTTPVQPVSPSVNYDIENYFLGMKKADLSSNPVSSTSLSKFVYKIDTKFNTQNVLYHIRLTGADEDAMAIDEIIKNQVNELQIFLENKYGRPFKTSNYPSFLEIEENQIFNVASWRTSGKLINLGIGEHDDLYYSIATIVAE